MLRQANTRSFISALLSRSQQSPIVLMLAALSAFAQGYAEREKRAVMPCATDGVAVHVSEKHQQFLNLWLCKTLFDGITHISGHISGADHAQTVTAKFMVYPISCFRCSMVYYTKGGFSESEKGCRLSDGWIRRRKRFQVQSGWERRN